MAIAPTIDFGPEIGFVNGSKTIGFCGTRFWIENKILFYGTLLALPLLLSIYQRALQHIPQVDLV